MGHQLISGTISSRATAKCLPAEFFDIVCKSRLLCNLPTEVQKSLLARARLIEYRRGEAIFHHGDTAHMVHIIADGWAKLYRVAPNGAETVVNILTSGQSFGEVIALRHGVYPVSAMASSNCRLVVIPASVLHAQIAMRPEFLAALLSVTSLHIHRLIDQIEQLKVRSGAQRVAEFLLDLCPNAAESAEVTLPYDKTLIAGRLGMKPESLSRAFARLRDHGVSIDQAQVRIASTGKLHDLLNADTAGGWA